MKKTEHYQLNKPEATDAVNIGDLNTNMDKVDTVLFEHTTDTTSHVTQEKRTEWDGKADGSHGHEFTEISGTPSTYPPDSHNHPWSDVTGQPTTYPPSAHSHPWSAVTSKPTTFTPSAHNQAWNTVTGKPTTFTPSTHTHQATQVPISAATATAIFGAGNKNVDQALAKLKSDATRVSYTTYVGTGIFGAGGKSVQTFPFKPLLVIVSGVGDNSAGGFSWMNGNKFGHTSASYRVDIEWVGNTIKWWNDKNATFQLNTDGHTYSVFAIG